MSALADQFFNMMMEARHPREAADAIALAVTIGLTKVKQGHVEELKQHDNMRELMARFYAHEGRAVGIIEAMQLLDQGESRRAIRVALRTQAHAYGNEAAHYQVLIKAMQ